MKGMSASLTLESSEDVRWRQAAFEKQALDDILPHSFSTCVGHLAQTSHRKRLIISLRIGESMFQLATVNNAGVLKGWKDHVQGAECKNKVSNGHSQLCPHLPSLTPGTIKRSDLVCT